MIRLGLEAGADTRDIAIRNQVSGVPIGAHDLVETGAAAIKGELASSGLSVCQVGAFGYNPLHPDADVLQREGAILAEALRQAPETGCPYVVICGGNYHPTGFLGADRRNHLSETLERIAEELRPYLAICETHGSRLCIEPYLKTAINSPARFIALKALCGSPALRVNLDVTSLYDYAALIAPEEANCRTIAALGPHCGLVHLKEVALLEGFHLHAGLAPMGAGATNWQEVVEQSAPYLTDDAWMIIEHVASAHEAEQSIALVRGILSGAGLAFQ